MARPTRSKPRELSDNWPEAECADPVAEVARQFAVTLREAIGTQSLRSVGAQTGVDHATISGIIGGRTWPDLATIARLEIGLRTDLWPTRRRRKAAKNASR